MDVGRYVWWVNMCCTAVAGAIVTGLLIYQVTSPRTLTVTTVSIAVSVGALILIGGSYWMALSIPYRALIRDVAELRAQCVQDLAVLWEKAAMLDQARHRLDDVRHIYGPRSARAATASRIAEEMAVSLSFDMIVMELTMEDSWQVIDERRTEYLRACHRFLTRLPTAHPLPVPRFPRSGR